MTASIIKIHYASWKNQPFRKPLCWPLRSWYSLLKQMQPVLSMVLTVPGNATSGNTHHHLLVMLTVATGWQASNHPFFTTSLSGKFWWGAKCLIKGEIKLLKSGHDSFHTPCSNLFIICQGMCPLLTGSPEGYLHFCVHLNHHWTLPSGLNMHTNNFIDFQGACSTYSYLHAKLPIMFWGWMGQNTGPSYKRPQFMSCWKAEKDLLWLTSRC